MYSVRSLAQGIGLGLFVVCLGVGSNAAAQTPSSGWTSIDVGPAAPGWTEPADHGFALHAAGSDVWDFSDEFRFVYRPLSGDGSIIALVSNLAYTDDWSKAGLMIRESLAANSKHASMFLTGTQGLAFQYRANSGGSTSHTSGPWIQQGFIWLKIQRQGSTLTGSYSYDAVNWATVGQATISMSSTAYIGLALTSHTPWAYTSAYFTNVLETETGSTGWSSSDIGSVALAGSDSTTSSLVSIKASGGDIWNDSDGFRYVFRQITGDGVVVARVARFNPADPWSKAGVMIRETLAANSKHAFMLVSGSEGLAFQRRAVATGGWTDSTPGGWTTAPVWLKLARNGSTVTASTSADGVTWTTVGSDTMTMTGTVFFGLAVTSHSMWAYADADFSDIAIAQGSSGSLGGPASSWTSADVGSPALAGSTSLFSNGSTLKASGADVWGSSDQFRFAYQQLTGDGTIVAYVSNLQYADAWSKAGVMIRETMSANSKHAFMFLTGTQGLAFQRRATDGGLSANTSGPYIGTFNGEARPRIWLRLQRRGSTLTGSYSYDAVNWATVGSDTIAMGSTVYAGFALSSHSAFAYATADFSNPAISGGSSSVQGNQSPTVSLTSPGYGATFAAGSNIQLTATASDPDGSVAGVDFYVGSTLIGSDPTSPYSVSWNGAPVGTHSLTAVARDNGGGMTVSSESVISVTTTSLTWRAVFSPSSNQDTAVNYYVLDLFPAGANPDASSPVVNLYLGLPPIINGVCDVSIASLVSSLAPGSYVATVTAVGSGGIARSAPSSPFTR